MLASKDCMLLWHLEGRGKWRPRLPSTLPDMNPCQPRIPRIRCNRTPLPNRAGLPAQKSRLAMPQACCHAMPADQTAWLLGLTLPQVDLHMQRSSHSINPFVPGSCWMYLYCTSIQYGHQLNEGLHHAGIEVSAATATRRDVTSGIIREFPRVFGRIERKASCSLPNGSVFLSGVTAKSIALERSSAPPLFPLKGHRNPGLRSGPPPQCTLAINQLLVAL
jgi:hypothetical protein